MKPIASVWLVGIHDSRWRMRASVVVAAPRATSATLSTKAVRLVASVQSLMLLNSRSSSLCSSTSRSHSSHFVRRFPWRLSMTYRGAGRASHERGGRQQRRKCRREGPPLLSFWSFVVAVVGMLIVVFVGSCLMI